MAGTPRTRSATAAPVETAVRNFIRTRGRTRLRRFVALLAAGETLRTIGVEFGLTWVRVGQLKQHLGDQRDEYRVHSDTLMLLDRIEAEEKAAARAARTAPG